MNDSERFFDDFGARLGAAAQATPRRERRRRTLAGTLAVACLLAVALLVAASSGPGGRRLDAVAAARAALAPHGAVVHLRLTTTIPSAKVMATRTTEQWTATDPPRWRLVQTVPRATPGYRVLGSDGRRVVGREELAYGGGRASTYEVANGLLTIQEGFADDGPAAQPPSLLRGDPATDLRTMLAAGRVVDAGLVRAHGRTVRRLTTRSATHGATHTELTYDVDPETFAPVGGSLRFVGRLQRLRPGSPPRTTGFTTSFRVDAYERLPLDARTAKLLEIAPARGARVVVVSREERLRGQRERAVGCVRTAAGNRRCPLVVPPLLRPRGRRTP